MTTILNYSGDYQNFVNYPNKGEIETVILNDRIGASELRLFTNLHTVISMKTPKWLPSITYITEIDTIVEFTKESRIIERIINTLPLLESLTLRLGCEDSDLIPICDAIAVKKTLRSVQFSFGSHSRHNFISCIARNKNIDTLKMCLSDECTKDILLLTNIKYLIAYVKKSDEQLVDRVVNLAKLGYLTELGITYLSAGQLKVIMEETNLELLAVQGTGSWDPADYVRRTINDRKMMRVVVKDTEILSLRSISLKTRPIPLGRVGCVYSDTRIICS